MTDIYNDNNFRVSAKGISLTVSNFCGREPSTYELTPAVKCECVQLAK